MKLEKMEFNDACILNIRIGTTGLRGGDAGHGGKTVIEFSGNGNMSSESISDGFRLEFNGDAELRTLIDALEFALGYFKDHSKEK